MVSSVGRVGVRIQKLHVGGLPPGMPGGHSSSCPAPSAHHQLEGWLLVSWLRLRQTPDSNSILPRVVASTNGQGENGSLD